MTRRTLISGPPADAYSPYNASEPTNHNDGSNHLRWDTADQLSQPILAHVPSVRAAGNHEIESTGIGAVINYTTYEFSQLPKDQIPWQVRCTPARL